MEISNRPLFSGHWVINITNKHFITAALKEYRSSYLSIYVEMTCQSCEEFCPQILEQFEFVNTPKRFSKWVWVRSSVTI